MIGKMKLPALGMGQRRAEKHLKDNNFLPALRQKTSCNKLKVKITVATKSNGPMVKTISLAKGKVTKSAADCWMNKGQAETVEISIDQMPKLLQNLNSSQAIIPGVCGRSKAQIVSLKDYDPEGNAIAICRTKDFFHYQKGQPGLMLIDKDDSECTDEELMGILEEAAPGISKCARVTSHSTTSFIFNSQTGKKLIGPGNCHIYIQVKDASDIPRFFKTLNQKLVLNGHGKIKLSKSGSRLLRAPIDGVVNSPERLIFEGPPICKDGLEQRRPHAEFMPGPAYDTSTIASLTDVELAYYESVVDDLKRDKKVLKQRRIARGRYIKARAAKIVKSNPSIPEDQAKKMVQRFIRGQLVGDFIIRFDDGQEATVREILADPQRYDKQTLPDPEEPSYGGGRCKAIFYANADKDQPPIIHSFAHGGRNYYLLHDFGSLKDAFNRMPIEELRKNWPKMYAHAFLGSAEEDQVVRLVQGLLESTLRPLQKEAKNAVAESQKPKSEGYIHYQTSPVDRLNTSMGFLLKGSKAAIVMEAYNRNLRAWEAIFVRPGEMRQLYANQLIRTSSGHLKSIFDIWMESESRNEYEGVEFRPDPKVFRSKARIISQGGWYNLWQGYQVHPKMGRWDKIKQHFREVWCGGDEQVYEYLLSWLADMFQKPHRQSGISLVLNSEQGAGKGIIVDLLLLPIFGIHGLTTSRGDDLIGRFNHSVGTCVFLCMNEAFWSGDKTKLGVLKTLISDPSLRVEQKFMDSITVRNCLHLIICANGSWTAPVELGNRRFYYLPLCSQKKGQHAYFDSLAKEINSGGREAFLFDMINRNLSGFNIRKLPEVQGEQYDLDLHEGFGSHLRFFADILDDGELPYTTITDLNISPRRHIQDGWSTNGKLIITSEALYRLYVEKCKQIKEPRPFDSNVLIRLLRKDLGTEFIKTIKPTLGDKRRRRALLIPELDHARALFKERIKSST
jgi:hypothetical protein